MASIDSKPHAGDPITIVSDGRSIRATFLKSTGANVEVVVTNPDGSSKRYTVSHSLCLLGWYDRLLELGRPLRPALCDEA